MLDTVKLRLTDYEIKSEHKLIITPGNYNSSGEVLNSFKLFSLEDGTEIDGAKSFCNTKNSNLTINGRGAFLQFSVPKVYHGSNHKAVNQDQSKEVLSHIEKELRENGIKTNIFDADLSRIDTVKQIIPDEPFNNYAPIFRAVNGSLKKYSEYGTTGFLFKNTVEQIAVYDKIQSMIHFKEDTTGLPEQMRIENRLMDKRKIFNSLEFTKASELIKYYDELEPNYNKSIKKNLFYLDTGQFNIAIQKELERRFEYYFDIGGRNWMSKFIYALGTDQVEIYGIDNFISLAKRKWDNKEKQKAYRLRKKISEQILVNVQSKASLNKNTLLSDLYNELKLKLVA